MDSFHKSKAKQKFIVRSNSIPFPRLDFERDSASATNLNLSKQAPFSPSRADTFILIVPHLNPLDEIASKHRNFLPPLPITRSFFLVVNRINKSPFSPIKKQLV